MAARNVITLFVGFASLSLPRLGRAAKTGSAGIRKSLSDLESVTAPYTLPELGFAYDALEKDFVGKQTMHLHHDKHHLLYVNTLNKALEGSKEAGSDIATLVGHIRKLPADIQGVVRNHGGGHMNHALLWKWLKPGGAQAPKDELKAQIAKHFGSLEKFQTAFGTAAAQRFGSGWAWLILTPDKKRLKVCSTANQDNPVMDVDIGDCHGTPVLGLDVWEHAYYLDFFNVRPDYVKAFWKVANWDVAEERFTTAMAAKEMEDHSAAHVAYLCPFVVMLGVALSLF